MTARIPAASATRPATARPRRATPPGPRRGALSSRASRWGKVALLVALVLVGIPVAHALAGEVAALLGAAILFGFLLGRWTAGRR